MIQAIFFDYHGVLDRRRYTGLMEVLIKAIPHPPADIRNRLEPNVYAYATGVTAPNVFWTAMTEAYGPSVVQAAKKYHLHVEPIREMWEAINRLHEKYAIGLFTDCSADKREVIIRSYNLPEFFDQLIFSCETRETKMDPNFYRRMLQAGRWQPEEVLLIDDSHQAIGQATSLGFQTHEFTSPKECLTFFQRL